MIGPKQRVEVTIIQYTYQSTEFMTDKLPTTLQGLESVIGETLLLADKGIIKLLCAAVITHDLDGDPVWLFIVGPSGGGKSEILTASTNLPTVHAISTLTPNTFASGMISHSDEPSLLSKLQSKILTFKDFTSVLSGRHEDRSEIMGQLREIYDGEYSKEFGNGKSVKWKGKMSLIAAVTTQIHTLQRQFAAMGERFLIYEMVQPDRLEVTSRSMDNSSNIKDRRVQMQEAFTHYTTSVKRTADDIPSIDGELKQEIMLLADLVTRARSAVNRDTGSSSREIDFIPTPEMPTRFANQLSRIAMGLILINGNGKLLPLDNAILYKVALDSIPSQRRMCLQVLAAHNEPMESPILATLLHYPSSSVRRYLEELDGLEIIKREKGGGSDKWSINEQYLPIIRKFEKIEEIKDVPIGDGDDDEEWNNITDDIDQSKSSKAELEQSSKAQDILLESSY